MRRSKAYLIAIRAINDKLSRVKRASVRAELIEVKDFFINDDAVAREELPGIWDQIVRGRSHDRTA